ncbi:exonuclease SbcCD subunit D C-terminal domain-containing protein, partial [Anaerotignum sp.]|uniref:exonuclease SbcCD subunit D C-terminal domain-containing protein n=1 Tax=Anaerotignum sp. TaxID=2039241 RepID=UPI00289B9253
AGSPLAYSFSEITRKKAITKVEFREKGDVQIDFIPFLPKRPLREIKGPLEGLLEAAKAEGGSEDYIRGILTDTMALNDPLGQLRIFYPNLMTLEVEARTYEEREFSYSAEDTSPKELFQLFFERQNQKEMNDLQKQAVRKAWDELGDEQE